MRAALLWAALLVGCAHDLIGRDHPLAGRIWDVRAAAFVAADEVSQRAATARHIILGETHDNPEHHRLQRVVLEAIAARGARRVLAMEQFDAEHQEAIDVAGTKQPGVEAMADAGRFDRAGWNWPLYRPLVEFALARGWPLVAANLSREHTRLIVGDPTRSGLPAADPALRDALERDIVEGHCGKRPAKPRLAGMVEAQRARDVRMADILAARGATVLIAGNGHARRDRGVPLYLKAQDVVSIGFVEVQEGRLSPVDYPAAFDYLWFTPRFARADPCVR